MTDQNSNNQSWWATLPGIITALATLITAVGGFIIILNSQSCNKENQTVKAKDSTPPTNQQGSPPTQNHVSQLSENITPISSNAVKRDTTPTNKYSLQYNIDPVNYSRFNYLASLKIISDSIDVVSDKLLITIYIKCDNRKSHFDLSLGSDNFLMEIGDESIAQYNPETSKTIQSHTTGNLIVRFLLPPKPVDMILKVWSRYLEGDRVEGDFKLKLITLPYYNH